MKNAKHPLEKERKKTRKERKQVTQRNIVFLSLASDYTKLLHLLEEPEESSGEREPFTINETPQTNIPLDDVENVVKRRRSVRVLEQQQRIQDDKQWRLERENTARKQKKEKK